MDMKEYQKQWYLKNKERLLEKAKEYRKNNPDKQKEWEKNNKEKRRIIRRRAYYKNPEKASEYRRKWREKHPEYMKNYLKDYLTNYKNDYYLTQENKKKSRIRILTWNKYGKAEICSLCDSKIKVEHHHIPPYEVDNFINLCKKCHFKLYHRKHK